MKCPACEFIFFDGRDICPKCLLDLRSYKKSMGIAITNPDTPYKELIKQRMNSGSVKRPGGVAPSPANAKPSAPPTNSADKNNKQFFSYFTQITHKIFDKPTSESSTTNQTTPTKVEAKEVPTKTPVPTPPLRPPTEIKEIKASTQDLAKRIQEMSTSKQSGPKVIDFSEEGDSIDQILTDLEVTPSNKGTN